MTPRLPKALASLGFNRIASLLSARARSLSPLLYINNTSVVEADSVLGIESNALVVIGNGSVIVAFSHISETPAAKGVSVVGIQSDRLTVICNGSIGVAFFRISDAAVG